MGRVQLELPRNVPWSFLPTTSGPGHASAPDLGHVVFFKANMVETTACGCLWEETESRVSKY